MLRFMVEIHQYLQRTRFSPSPPGYAPLNDADRTHHDEEALDDPMTSPPALQRNCIFRVVQFLLKFVFLTAVAAVIFGAYLVTDILVGVGQALVKSVVMVPALVVISYKVASIAGVPHDMHPIFQILVQFFQAGVVGAGAMFAVGGVVDGVVGTVRFMWTLPPLAQHTEVPQESPQEASQGVRSAVLEKIGRHFLVTPFVCIGARILRRYYGSGWELLVSGEGHTLQVMAAGIAEVVGEGVVVGYQYLRDRWRARQLLGDAEGAGDGTVKLVNVILDSPKP